MCLIMHLSHLDQAADLTAKICTESFSRLSPCLGHNGQALEQDIEWWKIGQLKKIKANEL